MGRSENESEKYLKKKRDQHPNLNCTGKFLLRPEERKVPYHRMNWTTELGTVASKMRLRRKGQVRVIG